MEKEIGSFEKNSVESVKLYLTSYKGKNLLEIRIWCLDKNGNWLRTYKGLCIGTHLINNLKDLLEKALQETH